MGTLCQFLHTFPATRSIRAYSSFFSSKPGGGRYFNPAKPPKVVPTAPKRNNKQVVDQAVSPDTVDGISTSNPPNESQHTHSSNNPQTAEHDAQTVPKSDSTSSTVFPSRAITPTRVSTTSVHPMIGDKDFKLHQFFSLHRPLLLLSNPPSIFAEPLPGTSIFSQSAPPSQETSNSTSTLAPEGIPPEASYEADAETARNLTRTMTMTRLGSTVDWEATLQRLGLELHTESERASLRETLEKEYRDVVMDSVKRKRRKKMKKHK
ncbi:hypothetical protein L218DRAFT_860097 [Marasmius fiardii PR-910]|nr:hypothetical protein L218DRAFT_860097 [Marasmius fiardii PR-910]